MMRVAILNDTARHGHPGCQLVMRRLREACAAHGLNVTAVLPVDRQFEAALPQALRDCDLVLINGEGTMHHDQNEAMVLMRAAIMARTQNKPVVLLNTVWEANSGANAMLGCVSQIYARECHSVASIAQAGFSARMVPDLSLGTNAERLFGSSTEASGKMVVLDDVRAQTSLLLARYARARGSCFHHMQIPARRQRLAWIGAGFWPRQMRLEDAGALATADVVVTGRFHGACLAIRAGSPFVAVASNTHKIEGLLEDAGCGDGAILVPDSALADDPYAALDAAVVRLKQLRRDPIVLRQFGEACRTYVELARQRQEAMFHAITALAHGQ